MEAYCRKCRVNWNRLLDDSVDDFEGTEACPLCRSDMDLEPAKPGDRFMYSPIDGTVKNLTTGEVRVASGNLSPAVERKKRRHKIFTESMESFQERQEQEEKRWVSEYTNLLKSMPPDMAAVAAKREKIERGFVWSDEITKS